MSTIQTGVLIAHTLISLLIIVLVLMQRGKGADAGAAFGSGASGTVFGARGSTNFFSRATAILATAFFATSLSLAYLSSQQSGGAPTSLLENATPVESTEPADGDQDAAEEGGLPELPQLDTLESGEAADDEMPSLEAETVGDDTVDDADQQ